MPKELAEYTEELYSVVQARYVAMATGTAVEQKVEQMMEQVVRHCRDWPTDKTGRWVGYAQCLLIEAVSVTTVEAERDFTRPLFHELYQRNGILIPDTVQLPAK